MNIKDVAKISGVGVSTVSRVINNHPDVKEETRQRVLEIIKETNYIPNNSARILKRNNTKNIGVMIKGVYNPFFSEMLKTIGNKIECNGYTMILKHNDKESDCDIGTLVSFIKEKRLKGVICLGGNFFKTTENMFDNIDIPVVLTSSNGTYTSIKDRVSSIDIDNIQSSYRGTKYIISKGHKNIALLLGRDDDECVGGLRLIGYKNALKESNIEFSKENILYGNFDFEASFKECTKLLSKNKDITAIFAISDIMAIGAAKAVCSLGLKIKKDVSIMGFDGMDICKYYEPSITTIKQPRDEMANMSVDLLFELLCEKCENKHILLNTELVKRDSV